MESDPSNRGLLRLVGNFDKASVPHVVGFKLAHYRNPSVAKYHRATVRAALKSKASGEGRGVRGFGWEGVRYWRGRGGGG